MVYNTTTRKTSSPYGVVTRVHGFGTSDSVEFVDAAKVSGTSYFESVVKQLLELGYERDKNILGAPYDFRRAPNELQDYFRDLKDLIEIAYNENDQQPAVIICHSMGCLNSLYFLNSRPQNWKDKYIRSLVSLSGVWGGSVKAMKAFASGDNFGVVVIPALSLRKDIRTFPSLAYLLPNDQVWPRDQVLLKNRNRNYTVQDYKQFFDDIRYPIGYQMWLDVRNLTSPRQPPGVEVHCLHGHKVTTMDRLEYLSGEFPDTARLKQSHGDGDGTVNQISLEACSQWRGKQKYPVHHEKFANIDHMAILSDRKVMEYLIESLLKTN